MTEAEIDPIRLPDIASEDQDLLNRLLAKLAARQPRNKLRAAFYDGKHAIRQVGYVIPPQYYRLGIVLGWSAKAVDILARRCNLDGFVWPTGDLDKLGLPDIIDDNFLHAEVSAALTASLIHGPAFSINTTGAADEPTSLIHFKDALNATGDWNARTRRMDNLLSITARDGGGKPTGLALYLDGHTITADKDSSGWQVDQTEHKWGVPVEALVYKPRIGRPMGSSRISRAVMSLHEQALRTVIRLEGHLDIYSFPELWMLGADTSVFKNEDGSIKPVWQVMLGRIKGIPDDEDAESDALARADVKQFPAAVPTPHLEALKQQAQLFSGETSIPLDSLGVTADRANPTSADAYLASREDLIAEAEGATDDWSPPLRRTIIRALAIANEESDIPQDWKSIDTKWRSPVHLSRAAVADAGSKQLTALPWLADTEVGMELAGLDEQQIKRALAEKRRGTTTSLVDKLTSTTLPDVPPPSADQTGATQLPQAQ